MCIQNYILRGGEVEQWYLFSSDKLAIQVQVRHGLFVVERSKLLPASDKWRHLDYGSAVCYHVCIIIYEIDPSLLVFRVGHCVQLAGICLSHV